MKHFAILIALFWAFMCDGDTCTSDAECVAGKASCSVVELVTLEGTCQAGWCANSTLVCTRGCAGGDACKEAPKSAGIFLALLIAAAFVGSLCVIILCISIPKMKYDLEEEKDLEMIPRHSVGLTEGEVTEFRRQTARLCIEHLAPDNRANMRKVFEKFDTTVSGNWDPEEMALYYHDQGVPAGQLQTLAYRTLKAFGSEAAFGFDTFLLFRHIQLLEDEGYRKALFYQLDGADLGYLKLDDFDTIFSFLNPEEIRNVRTIVYSTDGKMTYDEFTASVAGSEYLENSCEKESEV